MSSTARRLQAAWARRGWLASLLWPVSCVYGGLMRLRRLAYRHGFLESTRLRVPVVVVGNVVAGGAGKTPTVIALVQHLQQQGVPVGVVSRGYGRQRSDGDENSAIAVLNDSDPRLVGDEPLLIRQRTGAPVFVGRRRAEACQRLLARHSNVRVLVCDDGLQHLALQRDIEICVMDDRGVGNGWLLPAGPLREAWPRKIDLLLHSGRAPAMAQGYRGVRQLSRLGRRALGDTVELQKLAACQAPLVALAGIAQPEAFFSMLREQGLVLHATFGLPDHDALLSLPAGLPANARLICTEKDAAKLWALRPDAIAVPLEFTPEPAFLQAFDRLLAARLSSGSPTRTD